MFERFTDRARTVIVLAQEEARMFNHDWLGTEHILLGCIHAGGTAAKALESLGASLESVRVQVEAILGLGKKSPVGHIPFTPRAKKILELALRESLQLGHNYIGTEHILLGLLREGEGVAAQILVKLGVDLGEVRQRVIELLAEPEPQPEPSRSDDPNTPVHLRSTLGECQEVLGWFAAIGVAEDHPVSEFMQQLLTAAVAAELEADGAPPNAATS